MHTADLRLKFMDPADARVTQLRALEERALRLRLELSVVQTHINQLAAPIFAFPNEIFLRIFAFAISNDEPKSPSLGWIRTITHVCQLWRQIALANATLWARICTDIGPEWTEEMFRRSSSALLDIERESSGWHAIDETLANHLQSPHAMLQVRTLALWGPGRISEGIRVPAHSLRQLRISPFRPSTSDSGQDQILVLPLDLFAFHAPKLQLAKLRNCTIPWDSSIFNDSLEMLSLVLTSPRLAGPASRTSPSPSQLYGLLKRTPALTDLRIRNYLPAAEASLPLSNNSPVLELPFLNYIFMEGRVADCVQFLRCITFPPTAILSLRINRPFNDISSLYDVIPLLVSYTKIPVHAALPTHRLSIEAPSKGRRLTVSLAASDTLAGGDKFMTPQGIFIVEFSMLSEAEMVGVLKAICCALPLQHLVNWLSVNLSALGSAGFQDNFWVDLFWEMRNVRRLEVTGLPAGSSLRSHQGSLIPIDIMRSSDCGQSPAVSQEEMDTEDRPSLRTFRPIFPSLHTLATSVQLPDLWTKGMFLGYAEKIVRDLEWREKSGFPVKDARLSFQHPEGYNADWVDAQTFETAEEMLSKVVSNSGVFLRTVRAVTSRFSAQVDN